MADADTHAVLKAAVVPLNFHEANPERIVVAYTLYIAKNPGADTTSVTARLATGDYATPYGLFHDLKVACGVAIVSHTVGSLAYREIDQYFQNATELLLREVEQLGLAVFAEKERDDEDDTLDALCTSFQRISRHRLQPNQEVVTYVHKHEEPSASFHNSFNMVSPPPKAAAQPLFSSLTGRSVLDPRNTIVPDPYLVAKVVASPLIAESAPMKLFHYTASRMPPVGSITQVMENFFHPNWYTVEAPKWLTYKQNTLIPPRKSTLVRNTAASELRITEKKSSVVSFAPTSDSRNAVMSNELKQAVWFNDIGYNKLLNAAAFAGENESGAETVLDTHKDKTERSASSEPAPGVAELPGPRSNGVKLENLARFRPESVPALEQLKQEQQQMRSVLGLQKVISANLLELHRMRQKRYLQNTGYGVPSAQELVCYKKIMKLLQLLFELRAAAGKKITLQYSRKLPVLLRDYMGVLPGSVSTKSVSNGNSSRLVGIRTSQRKRNGRFN